MKEYLPKELFPVYDTLIFADTETTGLSALTDNVIELGAVKYRRDIFGDWNRESELSELIRLPEVETDKGKVRKTIPKEVSNINHITDSMLEESGIDAKTALGKLAQMIDGKTLFIAYNAHFDANFLMHEYKNRDSEHSEAFAGLDVYDAMLTARARIKGSDGRKASHTLEDILYYHGITDVENSHRALDDVEALIAVTEAFFKEKNDLSGSVNIFPYYEKYGIPEDHLTDKKFIFMNQQEISQKWPPTMVVPNAEELKNIKAGMGIVR